MLCGQFEHIMPKGGWFALVSIGIVVVVNVTILGKCRLLNVLVRIWLMGLVDGNFLLNILFIYRSWLVCPFLHGQSIDKSCKKCLLVSTQLSEGIRIPQTDVF